MSYNTDTAKIGDRILVAEPNRSPLFMTVWHISPTGDGGRKYSAGPLIHAHIKVGGYGIAFDAHSAVTQHITAA